MKFVSIACALLLVGETNAWKINKGRNDRYLASRNYGQMMKDGEEAAADAVAPAAAAGNEDNVDKFLKYFDKDNNGKIS